MSDAHEARLLLAILREEWERTTSLVRDRAPGAAAFVALARRCDVHPTVHARLSAAGRFDLVGPEVERELDGLRAKVRADNLLLLARAEQAIDTLVAAGIVPVALKGLDVLHRFHRSFDERTLDDVDLLVPRDRLEDAFAALERAGWTMPDEPERTHWMRSSFEMPLTAAGPVPVALEIHWSLGQEKRYRVDAGGLLARAKPLDACGRSILRLDENDAVAHLLVHHVQHYFDRRLKWALDLGARVRQPGFDWRVVAERLGAWGGLGAAGLSLLHVRKLFPEAVPAAASEAIPAAAWRRALGLPLRSRHPLDYYRGTRARRVQLFLAALALERPAELPRYLLHRATRDREAPGRP
jgi:hypothetical protein